MQNLGEYKYWKPEHQQRALDLLRERGRKNWKPFYCSDTFCDGHAHGDWDFEHARRDQRPPRWSADWLVWLLSGGRGSGKTRTGSEVTHRVSEKVGRIALIASTGPDFRSTMVEGVSGILATSPPGKMPLFEPSKKTLTWPNGCVAQGFSAEEPDRLRGPQHGFVWGDEPAHWPLVNEVWDQMLFGLRIGTDPKVIATSTPKPTKWMKGLVKDPMTIVQRVSTYENLANLSPTYKRVVMDRYEGTRLGRQELHGEILEDVEGAMWQWEMLQHVAETEVPDLVRIVVGVDPAGTANKRSDETGIITVGVSAGKNIYVMRDVSGKYSPDGWATRTNGEYDFWGADVIVPEKNYGGDMVRKTLESSGYSGARIKPVTSRRGKSIRAEPIVALYEKARVFHVGAFEKLEDEMTTWVPGEGDSPNRVDALVHAITEIAQVAFPTMVANPNEILTQQRGTRDLGIHFGMP